jgi:hypothetical protein
MTDLAIGQWVGAFLVGKTLAAGLASSQTPTIKVLAYGLGIPVAAMVAHLNLRVAAVLAVVSYLMFFRRVHVCSVINHIFVEFLILLLIVALAGEPDRLLSVLQVLVVSVWLYSVWQKLFHGQFLDGTVM